MSRGRSSRILARRPTPALVVACISLAVALSGTGYAVAKLPANSVGTAQLKKSAVTSAKVKNGALLAADFAKGQIPPGPPGPAGQKGDKGDKGDTGAQGPPGLGELERVVVTSPVNSNPKAVTATCPSGKKVLSAGASVAQIPVGIVIKSSAPSTNLTQWTVYAQEDIAVSNSWFLEVYALCARDAP